MGGLDPEDEKLQHRVVIWLGTTRFTQLQSRQKARRIRRLGEYARMLVEETLDRIARDEGRR